MPRVKLPTITDDELPDSFGPRVLAEHLGIGYRAALDLLKSGTLPGTVRVSASQYRVLKRVYLSGGGADGNAA